MVYQLKFVVAIFPLSNTLKSLNISIGKFVDSDLQKIVSIVKPSFVKNYLGAIQIICFYLMKNLCLTLGRFCRASL